jgi:hypothetical protein
MGKVIIWKSEDQQKAELTKRLKYAKADKEKVTRDWAKNERAIFGNNRSSERAGASFVDDVNVDFAGEEEIDNSNADVTISYCFKNWRYIHAQLSSNPPTVIPRPTSTDQADLRKAGAADKLIRYGLRHYKLQNFMDLAGGNTVGPYGNGFLSIEWDPNLGDVLEAKEDGSIVTEGDISVRVPDPWNIFINPDATDSFDLGWYFERMLMPYESALFIWPEKEQVLKLSLKNGNTNYNSDSAFGDDRENVVELFCYWESGTPINGYLGRYGVCLADGTIVQPVGPNPHRFRQANKKNPKFEVARLPLKMFTDVDVPNSPWGMTCVSWAANQQDTMNRLDTVNLDNVQAHGVARLVLPEGAEVSDESLTNTPWDAIKITGTQPPFFMSAPSLMPQIDNLRTQMKQSIDDTMGMNESMSGQQSREQSALSMQTATNNGNMIRHRLFNKFTMVVEELYQDYLDLIKKHWDTPRTINVLGKGKALDAVAIKGTDIDGGYDIIVEYGTSFSLDPTIRKQEIIQMIPIYEKAGIPIKPLIKRLRSADQEGIEDIATLAEDRQREIFEEILATGEPVQPRKYDDHANMLAYASIYVMTEEYKYLEDQEKDLIDQHITMRSQLMAQSQAPQQQPGAGVAGPGGQPGQAPQPTGGAGAPPPPPGNNSGQPAGPVIQAG